MIEVKVIVEIPGLPEAIHALAGAIGSNCATAQNLSEKPVAFVNPNPGQMAVVPPSGSIAGVVPDTSTIAGAAPGAGANPTQQAAANVPATTATPVQTGPVQMSYPSEAKAITLDDLGKAGAVLIDAGKMPQLIALLGKYGVQAVTQLKPEHFSAFADDLRALGAKF